MQEAKMFLVKNNESTFMFRIDGNCKYNSYGGSLHEHYLDETIMVKNSYLHYERSGISLAYGELENIRDNFNKLLADELTDDLKMSFLEPAFRFLLMPKNPNYKHSDILVDFIISIRETSGAYSNESYSICFGQDEIERWRDYLDEVLMLYKVDTAVTDNHK